MLDAIRQRHFPVSHDVTYCGLRESNMQRVILILILVGTVVCAPAVSADWTNLGIYGGRLIDIAIDPQNPDKLFAGTYLGGGLFVSQDGGSAWQAVQMDHLREGEDTFEDHAVYDVEISESNTQVVWATHNIWAASSYDGGQTWFHITNREMQQECTNCGGYNDGRRLCRALAIDPQNSNVVYIGTDGTDFGTLPGAVYKTVNGGGTWTKLNTDFDYRVEDLAIDPDDSSIIWAVTNSNGNGGWNGTIYRSTNSGTTWQPISVASPLGGLTAVAPRPDDSGDPDDPPMVFVTCGYGIVLLTHNGALDLWEETFPVPASRLATDVKVSRSNPNVVYASWMTPESWGGTEEPSISRGVYNGDAWR